MSLTPDEETTRKTYDKLAKAWTEAHTSSGFWKDEMVQFHALLPEGRVLEVGCGGGRDATELMELGYEYIGTDVSNGLLEQARHVNPGATFQQVSVYDLDFDQPFDGFWCAAVLLHIPKKRINEALQGIRKSVKNNAIGFIATKEGQGEKVETTNEFDGDGRLFVYYMNEEFKDALIENGFEVLSEGYRPMSERTKWLTYHVKAI